MTILNELLSQLPDGRVVEAVIGLFWTAVIVEVDGKQSCGLASTQHDREHEHTRHPAVMDAGKLEKLSACQLAALVNSNSSAEVSIGLATINALLPKPLKCVDLPAEEYIARQGSGSRVALIGHFPFIERLRPQVRDLWVMELNPKEGDLPASAGPDMIPLADILAVTSTALINHTFDEVFQHRKPGAKVMLLGPSTPVSPRLFDLGIDVLAGSIVEDPDAVLPLIRQGASFQQIKKQGVRLVTLEKNG
jgi:uncharacterized protein